MKAHKKAAEDGFYGTDDTVWWKEWNACPGGYGKLQQHKITTREDLIFAEALATRRDKQ